MDKNTFVLAGEVDTVQQDISINGFHRILTKIRVRRKSGYIDIVPVLLPRCFSHISGLCKITGEYRTFAVKGHLISYALVDHTLPYPGYDQNEIHFTGHICSNPSFRITPQGRKISDFMTAVNSSDGTSYIPCIAWGNTAVSLSADVGSCIRVWGRIQSRIYSKNNRNFTTYEISINRISSL